jgi:hypothetical protein
LFFFFFSYFPLMASDSQKIRNLWVPWCWDSDCSSHLEGGRSGCGQSQKLAESHLLSQKPNSHQQH